MSGTPPEGQRPLTFNPSADDKAQLSAFLEDVIQEYLARRTPTPEGALHEEGTSAQDGSTEGRAALPETASISSVCAQVKNQGPLKQEESFSNTGKFPDRSITELLQPNNSEETGSRKRRAESSASSKPPEAPLDPPRYSSAVKCAVSGINHALIETQLNAISRASLLRANTININAPDPEQQAPPEETHVEKRRRLERINGRRKRAKKLIEIESLNERLVSLVDRNKSLKTENEDFRKKINAIKRIQAEGGDISRIAEIAGTASRSVHPATDPGNLLIGTLRVPQAQALLHSSPLPLGVVQQPQSNLLLQHQHPLQSSFPFGMTSQQQQLFSSLLGASLSPPLATNQPSQLGSNQSFPFSHQPLQHQHLQQVSALLPALAATSGIYNGIPPNLQTATASLLQHPRAQLLSESPGNTRTVESAVASVAPSRRPGTPPPKTAKELKAWIKKHRGEE